MNFERWLSVICKCYYRSEWEHSAQKSASGAAPALGLLSIAFLFDNNIDAFNIQINRFDTDVLHLRNII